MAQDLGGCFGVLEEERFVVHHVGFGGGEGEGLGGVEGGGSEDGGGVPLG